MECIILVYGKGEHVIYNGLEICLVGETVRRNFDGISEKEYITLYPAELKTTVYVPMEKCSEMLRPVLSRENLLSLIDMMPSVGDMDVDFSEAVKSGDHKAIVSVMSTIYNKGVDREKSGKHLLKTDRRNFESAKKLIDGEIALAFGIKADEAERFIADRLAKRI